MSGRFQKNLRDYAPVESSSDKAGKKRIKYVYRGDTYTFRMTQKHYRCFKLALSLLCVAQLSLYLFITLRYVPSNSSFVMVPAACSLFAMGYMDMGIFTLLTSKMELPAWEYHSLNSRLKWGSRLSFFLLSITFLSDLAFIIFFSPEYLWGEIFNCICYLILTLVSYTVHTVWKRISFDIKEGTEENRREKELMDDIDHAFRNTSDFR